MQYCIVVSYYLGNLELSPKVLLFCVYDTMFMKFLLLIILVLYALINASCGTVYKQPLDF